MVYLISTHTLRGERDLLDGGERLGRTVFQLTRSVGSVTAKVEEMKHEKKISTHTLRGERDVPKIAADMYRINFNSHAPWGA